MNAVEIEEAISQLAAQAFNAVEFPYAFLEAFGNNPTTVKKLRSTNTSDVTGAVLQRNNIHLAVCETTQLSTTLAQLKASPKTQSAKAKYILATDGISVEAEELGSGETVVCNYTDLPNHFGFFLQLAGISTVKQIRESAFDIRATSRLNKLYIELLKTNPDWSSADRRHDMNHFMARLIFCFFAEDTDIFNGKGLFTQTIEQMSEADASNTHEVMSEIFRAMNTKVADRTNSGLRPWADSFPYVNGGLFSGSTDVPRFSKIARSYFLHVGNLDWTKINPDIFGSMIQAVADEGERSSLGMHYTSVPNILKVLNPLFLDDLRAKLDEAGDNKAKLLNLKKRIAKIRVFDPACGSGNFLVIAYKQLREIEATINQQRGEIEQATEIPVTNFRGIELRDFPAEIARLALIIAEYQCDVAYRGQKEALQAFLPLDSQNWITQGNALRVDWLSVCPPTGAAVAFRKTDLFDKVDEQAQIDFANEGGETYICGNPPYLGSTWQSAEQKDELKAIFDHRCKSWKSLDYVAGWFMKAADYGKHTPTVAAFVSTNSICQGQQVPILWPLIFATGHEISFAHTSFKWANLASHNAGVTVAIVAIAQNTNASKRLYSLSDDGTTVLKEASNINAYLVASANVVVDKASKPLTEVAEMKFGNKAVDGGNLLFTEAEFQNSNLTSIQRESWVKKVVGSAEFIRGYYRHCLWITDDLYDVAMQNQEVANRVELTKSVRKASRDVSANELAKRPHQFREMEICSKHAIFIPSVSSENRYYLPCGLLASDTIVLAPNLALYDAPLWNMALIASRLHLVWIATVCGKLETRYRYSNTLGWNTFPVPKLTDKNKADLTRCAEDILLAREAHYPATIADLYEVKDGVSKMPANLKHAHERNDEVLERIYIGRTFKNDTERLEKLFALYTEMTTATKKNRTHNGG